MNPKISNEIILYNTNLTIIPNTNLVIKWRKDFVGNFFMKNAGRSVKKYLAGIFSERASQARRQ